MDMGSIVAHKKRYKYTSLKKLIAFHELPEEMKQGWIVA